MISFILGLLAGAVVGGAYVAKRLKGEKTWREAGAVIFGGGGPGPIPPR